MASSVRYTEASMRTSFGLKYLYKFFNVPFLQLQREYLMQQLETNAREMDLMSDELKMLEENLDEEYDSFSQNLNTKRRQQQEENAKDVLKNAKSIDEARKAAADREAAEAAAAAAAAANDPKQAIINNIVNKTKTILPAIQQTTQNVSMSVTVDPKAVKSKSISPSNNNNTNNKLPQSNDNPLLNDDELNSFLSSDIKKSDSKLKLDSVVPSVAKRVDHDDDDDDDEEVGGNPMVAAFKETLDDEEDDSVNRLSKPLAKAIDLSDNDEEEKNQAANQTSVTNVTLTSAKSRKSDSIKSELSMNQLQIEDDMIMKSRTSSGYDLASNLTVESSNNDAKSELKFTNEDFSFLESLSAKPEPTPKTKTKKSSEKSSEKTTKSKSKSSSKKSGDAINSDDTDNLNDSMTAKSSKKKSSKDESGSKKSSKTSKSSKEKSSSSKKSTTKKVEEDDDDDDDNKIVIKKDLDYEEL